MPNSKGGSIVKEKKTEFRWFTIVEYEKEQEYLRRMHQKGWKFARVTFPGFYHFEKCEPEDVVYQLDYNQEGIAHKEEYVQMFNDYGWEYLMDYVGYSYFRKTVSELGEEEGIFCDDSSRQDMMKRVFRGRMIPLVIIFFGIIIPQLFLQFSIKGFSNPLFITFVVLFVLYMTIFLHFGVQYWNYRKRVR